MKLTNVLWRLLCHPHKDHVSEPDFVRCLLCPATKYYDLRLEARRF